MCTEKSAEESYVCFDIVVPGSLGCDMIQLDCCVHLSYRVTLCGCYGLNFADVDDCIGACFFLPVSFEFRSLHMTAVESAIPCQWRFLQELECSKAEEALLVVAGFAVAVDAAVSDDAAAVSGDAAAVSGDAAAVSEDVVAAERAAGLGAVDAAGDLGTVVDDPETG